MRIFNSRVSFVISMKRNARAKMLMLFKGDLPTSPYVKFCPGAYNVKISGFVFYSESCS